nr:13999_t:CDS:2 [Entrophospora candida]
MDPELSLYIDKAQLDDDETRLIFNPPCKIYSQISGFISPNPNNVNSIGIPKSQNSFFLYRKNYTAKHKSSRSKKDWKILSKEAGNAWSNESNEVKNYFKVLAKLALQKHKLTYENILLKNYNNNFSTSLLPYPHSSSFSSTYRYTNDNTSSSYQRLKLQQKQKDHLNNNDCAPSSPHPYSKFSCTSDNTNSPHFMTRQPKIRQKHEDNLHNNDSTSSLYSHSNFSCANDNTHSPHFMTQQPELRQKQKDDFHKNNNKDCESSSPHLHPTFSYTKPHLHSTFPYTSDSTNSPHFVVQQPEIQQKQKDNFYKKNNKDCVVSSSPPHLHSTFSCTNLPHFMTQQLELQQKQKEDLLHKNNNNDCAISSSSYPYSTFSYKDDSIISLRFATQQPEIQQKQKDEKNNNDCVVSSSSYPHFISFDFDTNADWNTIIDYFRF